MLLFIVQQEAQVKRLFCFNTSHVTLYPVMVDIKEAGLKRFNTSHVTLYPTGVVTSVSSGGFQYISCYSLSTFWTYMNTSEQRFNTSHVTLYLCCLLAGGL